MCCYSIRQPNNILHVEIVGVKRFILKNIINSLRDVEFSSADWYDLGVQLERPPNQLSTIR